MQRALNLLKLTVIMGLMFTLTLSFSAVPTTNAQEPNALQDPGLDGDYTNRGRSDLNIPANWGFWYTEAPRSADWMNLVPTAFPHGGPGPDPHGGSKALNFSRGYATFTVAIYQQVAVTSGSNVTASAWAQIKTCDVPANADNCQSNGASGGYVRVGIDPNGGTNPYDADIVWSPNIAPHDTWQQATTSATTTGTTATVFVFASQNFPSQLNRVYLDDVYFGGGGAGGSAPQVGTTPGAPPPTAVPPPPQEVPFVVPQNARPDGSIVHRISPGDTVDSIAVAYGLTRPDIMALNPTLRDPRFIQIGQELIVQAATTSVTPTQAARPTQTQANALPPDVTPEDQAVVEQPTVDEVPVEQPTTDEPTPDDTTAEVPPEATDEPEPTPEPQLREPLTVADAAPAPVRSVGSGVQPSIDPSASTSQICVSLFNDINHNRIQELGEALLEGGTVIISKLGEAVDIPAYQTDGTSEPYCFTNLAPADYIASIDAPAGYGLTTPNQFMIRTQAGAAVNVIFGAAEGVAVVEAPPADEGGIVNEEVAQETDTRASNPITDNLGLIVFGAAGFVLLAGMGVTLFMRRR